MTSTGKPGSKATDVEGSTSSPHVMVAHIVAAARNGVIGKDGELPWSIPEDMKWFRERTRGHALIMGRKTYESVEHPLPHRLNVIVTRQKDYKPKNSSVPNAPVHVVATIEEGLTYCRNVAAQYGNEIFIIGGGEIYHQSVRFVDTIYLTRIHRDVAGDATYPDPDLKQFELVEKLDRFEPEAFSFETYKRRS
jgi:dihydrofolate reductase